MTNYIIIQILSAIALIIVLSSYFVKNKVQFLLFNVFANIFYGTAFILQNALVGELLMLISTIRCLVFFFCQKYKFKYSYIFLIFFICCHIAITIIFWSSWLDIFPCIASCIYTTVFFIKDINLTRYLMIPPSCFYVVYSIFVQVYINAITSGLEVIIAIISIIYVKIRKNKEKIVKNE